MEGEKEQTKMEGGREKTKDWKIVAAQKTLRFFFGNRETLTFLAGASLLGYCTLVAISEVVTVSKMCYQNCTQAYHELGDIMDKMSGKVK
jgi:IS1 family transposase